MMSVLKIKEALNDERKQKAKGKGSTGRVRDSSNDQPGGETMSKMILMSEGLHRDSLSILMRPISTTSLVSA